MAVEVEECEDEAVADEDEEDFEVAKVAEAEEVSVDVIPTPERTEMIMLRILTLFFLSRRSHCSRLRTSLYLLLWLLSK